MYVQILYRYVSEHEGTTFVNHTVKFSYQGVEGIDHIKKHFFIYIFINVTIHQDMDGTVVAWRVYGFIYEF